MSEPQQDIEQSIPMPEMSYPGHRLREARESARMSLEEVAHHLHLDVQIIKSLEEDEYDKLPSPIYISGYLRAYARLMKLPEAEIVGAYTKGQEINASLIPENVNILPGKKRVNHGSPKLFYLIILLVVIGVIVIWFSSESGNITPVTSNSESSSIVSEIPIQQSLPASVPETSQDENALVPQNIQEETVTNTTERELIPPSAQQIEEKIAQQEEVASAEQTPTVDSGATTTQGNLRLVFRDDSWVEVTDSSGTRFVYRLEKAGGEIVVDGQAPYKILLGNASGVDVYFEGQEFDHTPYHRDEIAYFRIGATQ